MGGNGSAAAGTTNLESGRQYKTVATLGGNIKILQKKNANERVKLPEESHTPNRIYATFEKDGSDLKSFAIYGPDCKKIVEIHTHMHDGIKPHYHKWHDGHPDMKTKKKTRAYPLTAEYKELLEKIRNLKS